MTRISKHYPRTSKLPILLLCFQIYTVNLIFKDTLPSLPIPLFLFAYFFFSGFASILPDLGKMVRKMLSQFHFQIKEKSVI